MGADKELIRKRFEANFSRYHRLALVQREICVELKGLAVGLCDPASVLRAMEIGVGTGFLTSHLADMFPQAEWYLNDISDAAQTFVAANVPERTSFIWGDAESVEFPQHLDLIASASTVQWFDDLPHFALRAAAATNSGGWFVMSTFGPDNFREIRNTTGEGLEYYTLDELRDIFEGAGYGLRVLTQYTRSLRFDTPLDVLHHIKATGVNSLGRTRWGHRQFTSFDEKYKATYSMDVGVTLTYHPILLVAQKL